MHRVISDLRTFALAAVLSLLAATSAQAQAELASDQPDYAPGATAYLTGTGFAPNETVAMQVVHADGEPSTGEDHEVWYVDADDQGGFVTSWHVCEDDCVGELLLATADQASGAHAETLFTDANCGQFGNGVVSLVTGNNSSSCVAFTAAGNDNWEVVEGGSYTLTITGATDCTGDTITVFVQHSNPLTNLSENFCFNATGGDGTYSGTFTMPTPNCATSPISYKCGANASCDNADAKQARGPSSTSSNCRQAHLRAATFDSSCDLTGTDENCEPEGGGCTPCPIVADADDLEVECDGAGNLDELAAWLASHGGASVGEGCSVEWSDNFTGLSDDCGETGSATVTFTATDDCGDSTERTATFSIVDTTAPTIDVEASGDTVQCDGTGNAAELQAWLASHGGASATDDCGGVTWTNDFDGLSDGCGATGSATVTFTATDDCGNHADTKATFTIEDTTDPTLDAPAEDMTVPCDGAGNGEALQDWLDSNGGAAASDGCSDVTWSNDFTGLSDGCGATGSAIVTFTAKDDCGNDIATTATFTIQDTTDPTIDCLDDVTVSGNGECCVPVDLEEPATDDGCSGVTLTNDAPAEFCIGDTTVTWTAKDDCGNDATCTQTVTVLGQICAKKFYDVNANGLCDGSEAGVPGWKITVTGGDVDQTAYTDSNGNVCFDVPVGTYTVTEGSPTQTNWVHTTAASCSVTVDSDHCTTSCSFGNYCYSAPSNGLTLGFWTNKNGEKLLNSAIAVGGKTWQQCLNDLACLRNANGTLHNFTTYADLKSWLLNATATNMAYMLSAQLAANVLDKKYNGLGDGTLVVVPGGVKTLANVCIVPFLSVNKPITAGAPPLLALTVLPGSTACGCSSNDGLVTIGDLRTRACDLLKAYGNTTAASTQRTYQECVKDILDMINNNGNPSGSSAYPCGPLTQYINAGSSSCPATFPSN